MTAETVMAKSELPEMLSPFSIPSPGRGIRFDPTYNSRRKSPSPSRSARKCSSLIEKPEGVEWRASSPDTSCDLGTINSSASHIAGPRLTVAKCLGLDQWQRGLTVLGCFMLMFNSWGLVNTYGTYQSYYKQHLLPNQSMATLNLIGSTQSFWVLLLSLVVGRVLDAGHFYRLTVTGGVLVTLGSFLLSLRVVTHHFINVWLVQGFLMSLGMACMFVPSSQIVASWFTTWKTVFMGIVASGASLAGLVYPVMLKHMIPDVGFHVAQRYLSIVTACTCVIAAVFAIPNPDRVVRRPESWKSMRVFFDKDVFRNKSSLGLVIGIGLLFTGFYAVFFNLEDWAADMGFGSRDETPLVQSVTLQHEVPADAIRTFWLLCIMNACSTFGRIGFTLLGDFIGALRTHAGTTFAASIILLAMWTTTKSLPQGLAFTVLYGIVSGADIALPPGSMANILGDDAAERAKLGQWVGMVYMCAAPFALIGPVLGGLLIGINGLGYLPLQLWCGIALMASAGSMLWGCFYLHPINRSLAQWAGWTKGAV